MTAQQGHHAARMIWRIARRHRLAAALSVSGLLLAGLLNGIGVAALLPMLSLALHDGAGGDTAVHRAFDELFAFLDLAQTIEIMLVLVVLVMTLKAAISLVAMRQVGYAAARVSADARIRLIRAAIAARWSHFVSLPSGRLSSVVSVEAQKVGQIYNTACKMMAEFAQSLFYAIIALSISWQVTLASVAVGLLIIYLLKGFIHKTRLTGREQTTRMSGFNARLIDGLNGMKPLKAMGGDERLGPLLEGEIRGLEIITRRLTILQHYVRVLQEPITIAALALGLYVLLGVWQQGLESLVVLALLFSRTVGSINGIQKSFQNIYAREGGFWLLTDMTEDAKSAREVATGERVPMFTDAIELHDVSFAYGGTKVLEHAFLRLPAGGFAGLTGRSGSGKTTTADLIIGLQQPQSGAVTIDGVALADIDIAKWRRMTGYVPQETILFHDSILTNVTLDDETLSRADAEAALRAAGAWDFVSALPDGIDTVVGERGGRLSGGQRQRIAIARALVRKPKLLILDEATTALDSRTEAAICETLRGLAGAITILAVSHQPAVVEAADTVYVVDHGQLTMAAAPAKPEQAATGAG